MLAISLIAAGAIAAGLWWLSKRNAPAALLILCALGALVQGGALRTPLHAPAERAAQSVSDAQRRLSDRMTCRMLLLAALASDDPAELDAVEARCEGVWEPGEDPFRTARRRTAA